MGKPELVRSLTKGRMRIGYVIRAPKSLASARNLARTSKCGRILVSAAGFEPATHALKV